MPLIDDVREKVGADFNHLSGSSYVRILDTPHVWGMPFGKAIMPQAHARQAEFERAIVEIIQNSRYRCDLASLNSPDPDWAKAVMGAMDVALTKRMDRDRSTQFRFLFGQTPLYPVTDPPNYTDLKCALIRLVRNRRAAWEDLPDIWMGRFYRLGRGILTGLKAKVFGKIMFSSDDATKMTWNHSKIIVVDGAEALVGGHNLNMDLFMSYPPVHDASVVVHGDAAYGSQLFLDEMWACGTDLLTREYLDVSDVNNLSWKNADDGRTGLTNPLGGEGAIAYMGERQRALKNMHETGEQDGVDEEAPDPADRDEPGEIREQDLQTLEDLEVEVFPERITYNTYEKFSEYKLATRVFSAGKYWTGPTMSTDYKNGAEVMKEELIAKANSFIRMSQMDLVSAWKKNWSDHVVCQWIMKALRDNGNLQVLVVVSPLDAGAGAEGDQYSFGSGAGRTFELMKYYMTHDVDTDAELSDADGARADAMKRLHIAPLYFTEIARGAMTEGDTYKWPDLSPDGKTATLKQPPLEERPPTRGNIGSAALSVVNASGYIHDPVDSAPGNHAKVMIIDEELYVVGSDNLYPGFLSEFNYLVEGDEAVNALLESYWKPLWQYSNPHCVNPECTHGCQSLVPLQVEVSASRRSPNTVRS